MSAVVEAVRAGRLRRRRARRAGVLLLAALLLALLATSLMVGNTFYGPLEVARVIAGETVPGASFAVGELRLPRSVLAALAGAAFGMAGTTFQTMLRNALASPDIIGISSGASAAAVVAIVLLHLPPALVSVFAVVAALATAAVIHLLSRRDGVVGTRLVLVGIGISAMLNAVVSWMVVRASTWDVQAAMQWLTGSVNQASWAAIAPLAVTCLVAMPVLLAQARGLGMLQLGDDTAAALGEEVERRRLVFILAAVLLVAFATAAAGPIAFVAFLSGPLASRIVRGGGSLLVPAALVGALLVLGADFAGQFLFATRYPVGVITGAIGAPYLLLMLVRTSSSGGSL